MSNQWHYSQEGAQYGSVDESEIVRLIQEGELPPSAPVCKDGSMDWQPARNHACFQVEVYPKKKQKFQRQKKRPDLSIDPDFEAELLKAAESTVNTAAATSGGGTSQPHNKTVVQSKATTTIAPPKTIFARIWSYYCGWSFRIKTVLWCCVGGAVVLGGWFLFDDYARKSRHEDRRNNLERIENEVIELAKNADTLSSWNSNDSYVKAQMKGMRGVLKIDGWSARNAPGESRRYTYIYSRSPQPLPDVYEVRFSYTLDGVDRSWPLEVIYSQKIVRNILGDEALCEKYGWKYSDSKK
jgi:hypothetical protein